MTVERKQVGPVQNYCGHTITVHLLKPDYITRVDGQDLPNFYTDPDAASAGGMRYIDDLVKAEKKN